MKKLFNLLVAGTIALCSQAQTNYSGTIFGSIKDGGNQKIIDAASISLLSTKDSSIVKTAVADKEGKFLLENIKDGSYLVLATSIGHAKTYSDPFSVSAATPAVNVGILQLVPAEKSLAGVTVVSKKPFIERKADKTILT